MAGLVIRTVYNNRDWRDKCIRPLADPRCYKCRSGFLYINAGNPIREDPNRYCAGDPAHFLFNLFNEHVWCWEQALCRHYFWGNPIGEWGHAYPGMDVFFVYQEPDRTYTLWGRSKISEVHNEIEVNENIGQYPYLIFEPFEAFPENRRVIGLTALELVGTTRWNMPFYRYIDQKRVNYLLNLIEGGPRIVQPVEGGYHVVQRELYQELRITLRRDIIERLNQIANIEGRQIEELIREAVARLIRERGF